MQALNPALPSRSTFRPRPWLTLGVLLGALLWSHATTVRDLCLFWTRNADYSIGALVAPAAILIVWHQRAALRRVAWAPSAAGLAVLAVAEVLRVAGAYFGVASAERYALVVSVSGAVFLVCGGLLFRKLLPTLAFLLLMVPPPGRLHEAIALPLQQVATRLATFSLELAGYHVVREGHVLRLGDGAAVAVGEACSGLRMLTAFVVVAALLVLLIDRPLWHKCTILLMSIPVAILCNAARIVLTSAVVDLTKNPALVDRLHDGAGLAMMPLAVVLLVGVMRLLAAMDVPGPDGHLPAGAAGTG